MADNDGGEEYDPAKDYGLMGQVTDRFSLPYDLTQETDWDGWDIQVDPNAPPNPKQANTYILKFMNDHACLETVDEALLEEYRAAFAGWKADMFSCKTNRFLKKFLRERGIYTGYKTGSVVDQLVKTLQLNVLPVWPPGEASKEKIHEDSQYHIISKGNKSQWIAQRQSPRLSPPGRPPRNNRSVPPPMGTPHPPGGSGPQQRQPPTREETVMPSVEVPPPLPPDDGRTFLPVQDLQQNWGQWRQSSRPAGSADPQRQSTVFRPKTGTYMANMGQSPYTKLPPDYVLNGLPDPDKISKFLKSFDNNYKWSGEPYDFLDDKVRIMLNICHFNDIYPNQFYAILPRILKGRAEHFYINHIGPNVTFQEAYLALKDHFETDTNRMQYYHDWTNLTFNNLRNDPDNANLSPRDVFRVLLEKLQLCQRALGHEFQGEQILRMTVIRACEGVQEFEQRNHK